VPKTEPEGGRKWSLSCSQEHAFFFNVHFNSILPSTPRSYGWSLFFSLYKQRFKCSSVLLNAERVNYENKTTGGICSKERSEEAWNEGMDKHKRKCKLKYNDTD
jgi:hypothetical protein